MGNIGEILEKSAMAYENLHIHNKEKLLEKIFEILRDAKEEIESANKIDIEIGNGKPLDMERMQKLKELIKYKKEINTSDSLGLISVIYEGNPYVLVEMIVKAMLTNNVILLTNYTNYMKATNGLIIELIKRALKENKAPNDWIQVVERYGVEELLSNSASIKKVIVIGPKKLQNKINEMSSVEVVTSGFGYCDLYLENSQLIEQELSENTSIYIKKGVEVPYKNCVEVKDIEEAIGLINFNTAGFESVIFTANPINSKMFTKKVKTIYVDENKILKHNEESDVSIKEFLLKRKHEEPKVEKPKEVEPPKPKEESSEVEVIDLPKIEKEEAPKPIEPKEENREIEILRKENEEQEVKISELTRQLEESHSLTRKYISALERSKLGRIFSKLNKKEIEQDKNLLS